MMPRSIGGGEGQRLTPFMLQERGRNSTNGLYGVSFNRVHGGRRRRHLNRVKSSLTDASTPFAAQIYA